MGFWIIVFIIVGIIACIIDDGNFLSRLALASAAASVLFLLLKWITGLDIMMTFCKISASIIVVAIFINILIGIFGKNN